MYLYPTLLHIQKFVTVLYYIVDYNTLAVKRKTTRVDILHPSY